MDFWSNVKKAMNGNLPKSYSFLLEDSRELINTALTLSLEEHKEKIQRCKECVNTYQYSVGGEVLHRGYYCPSLIKDIVMGNCNRGRLVKNTAKTKKVTYEYGFRDNQLLLVRHNISDHLFEIEYISYFGNKQIGYTFDNEMQLRTISECVYHNEKLKSYFLVNYDPFGLSINCEKEIYEYDSNLLHSVTVYLIQAADSCLHNKYVFYHDSNGYLSSYKVDEFENGNIKEDFYWKDHLFKITMKRRA